MGIQRIQRIPRIQSVLGWVVAVAVAAYLLSYPRALGHADESDLLDGARRVLAGEVLYREYFTAITPGAFYLFAALFALTGPSLLAARVVMAVVNGIAALLLFRLTWRVAGAPEAVVAVLVFAVLCVPVWQIASPHWLSTCLALAVAAVLLADRWRDSTRARPAVAGLVLGVALSVQQHRGTFLAVWFALALVVLALAAPRGQRWRRLWLSAVWAAAGAAPVLLVVLAGAAWQASVAEVYYALFTFVRESYGPATAGTTPWAGYIVLSAGWLPYTWHFLLRGSPLALLAEAVALAVHATWRRAVDPTRVALLLLGAMMAVSIIYFPDYIHVAFVMPFLVMPAAAVVGDLRRLAARGGRLATGAVGLGLAGLVVALIVQGAANVRRAGDEVPARFESGVGPLRDSPHAQRLVEAVRRALAGAPAGETPAPLFYSYPDDAWLYLAVPGWNPTPLSALLRGFHSPAQIAQASAAVRARRPSVIVALHPWLVDGDPIKQLLDEHYAPVEDVGPYRVYRRTP